MHLRAATYQKNNIKKERYPFNVPTLKTLESIRFRTPVTILVGENGTGKSTFMEALAAAVGSITVGAESVLTDPTLEPARQLAKHLKLEWSARTQKGFFLRSEDFFNYVKRLSETRSDMEGYIDQVERDYEGRSDYVKSLAMSPYKRSLAEMESRYGKDLDANSHGESFFQLFHSRFTPGGLYLMDEPESPLSPMKQLAFIAILKEAVAENSQFIIATHSPILMAYPGATILNFDHQPIKETKFDELEHVNFMRDFLTHPEAFLRHL